MADEALMFEAGALIADRYRVEAALGRGGMGSVYLVFDEIVGEKVALKVLSSHDRDAIDRFKVELRLARRVTHKNIGRTFDLGKDNDSLFITMEAVTGESLRAMMIRKGAIPANEVGALLAQVSLGLSAAHEAGVVHRDLKPTNILLEQGGRVVVIDFGVAAPLREQPGGEGMVSGTYDYMSPEQLRGQPAFPSDDVYALGIVAFELATLARPFAGADGRERAALRLKADPDLSALATQPHLQAIVAACLAREASVRPTALQIEPRFRAIAGDATTTTLEVSPASALGPDNAATAIASQAALTGILVARFEVVGSDETFDLGSAIAEEISDALAQSKGLRVVSTHGVPAAALGDVAALRAHGIDYLVRGTVQRSGNGTPTVTSRLVATASGQQAWTSRFGGSSRGWTSLGTEVAVRIAEALRLELELLTSGPTVSPEAAMAFLEGRRLTRSPTAPAAQAVASLDRCLAGAPDFPLAIAARAMATVRAYTSTDDADGHDWASEARSAVERAQKVAPDAADTHLAAALLHLADCRYEDGVRALARVLSIAPTHAQAHETLGRIESEAGRAELAMTRLTLALEIDPLRRSALCLVARAHALRGRVDVFDELMDRVATLEGAATNEECVLMARVAVWYRDRRLAQRALDRIPPTTTRRTGAMGFASSLARIVLGDDTYWDLHERGDRTTARPISNRFRCTANQVLAEYETMYGDPLKGLKAVEATDALGLIDVEWLELCHALDILRDEDRFIAVRENVRRRAAAVWPDDIETPSVPLHER